jgi:gliding motility-associated-like protein
MMSLPPAIIFRFRIVLSNIGIAVILLLSGIQIQAQTQQQYTTPGIATFTVPACVYSIQVICIGGGGAGYGMSGGGGGGGGAMASKIGIAVTPGQTYTLMVGSGGAGSANNAGGNGGNSVFGANLVVAQGGRGATSTTGGTGGVAGSSVGDVINPGGNGGNSGAAGGAGTGNSPGGGGGGSNGGAAGAGGTGAGSGGNGGAGGANNAAGSAGNIPGGGGGGAGGNFAGGNGGRGIVIVSYSYATTQVNSATVCVGQQVLLTAVNGDSFLWSTGETTSSITTSPITASTSYTVSGAGTCSGTAVSEITIYKPVTVSSGTICIGNSITLYAGGYPASYLWSTGATTSSVTTPTLNTVGVTSYTVTGNNCGVTSTAIAYVVVRNCTSTTITTTGTSTWTAPSCVYAVDVEVWGGGGGAGAVSALNGGTGGGGGGAYSMSTFTITPGTGYTVRVGTGGSAGSGSGAGGAGGDSWFSLNGAAPTSNATGVLAKGGNGSAGGIASAGGTGGAASNGYGTIKYSGGKGGNGNSYNDASHRYEWGGGGGAAAGSNGNGGNGGNSNGAPGGSAGAGGISPPGGGGGNGGDGSNAEWSGTGDPGGTPGGGAGGSADASSGLAGSRGQIVLTYEISTPTAIVNSAVICSGETATLTASGANTYNWSPGTGLSATTGASVIASPTVTATYTVTGTKTGCTVTATGTSLVTYTICCVPGTITLTSATGSDAQVACLNSPITTITYSVGGGATNATISGTLPTGVIANYNAGTKIVTISGTPTETGTYNYMVTITGGCGPVYVNGSITVKSLPTGTLSGTTAVCENSTSPLVTFTGLDGTPPYTFTYRINSGANQFITTDAGNSTTTAVPTNSATTYTYTLINVQEGSSSACSQNISSSVTATISPIPNVISSSATTCSGITATITATGASNYVWSTGETTDNISQTLTSTTSYTVTGGSYSCTATAVGTIYVQAELGITFNSETICSGETATLTASGATNYVWSTGETTMSITVSPISTTNYSVTGTSSGCNGSGTGSVTVNELPTGTVSGGGISVCRNSTPEPTITFTGSAGTAPYSFSYSLNDGSSVITNTITSVGTSTTTLSPTNPVANYTYSLTGVRDNNSCYGSVTSVTRVTIDPAPGASISGATSVCKDATQPVITFTGSDGNPSYTFTYNINGIGSQTVSTGAGVSTATISAPTNVPGDYVYNLTGVSDAAASACGAASGSITIKVRTLPTATLTGSSTVCQNTTNPQLTFTASNGTAPFTYSYTVNGANATITSAGTSTLLPITTAAAATFTHSLVSVVDTYGCTQTQTASTIVRINPAAQGDISGDAVVCQNTASPNIVFTGTNGDYPYHFSYKLDAGVTNTVSTSGANSSVSIAAPTGVDGTYTYSLIAVEDNNNAGCSSVGNSSATVNVDSLPLAVISGISTICQNATKTVTGAIARNGSILWTHNGQGNISNATTLSPTYASAAGDANNNVILTMTVTGTTTCTSTSAATYTIHVDPIPEATTSGAATICQNATYTLANGEATRLYGSVVWTENGQGSITAGGTTLNPTYTAATADAGSVVTLTMTVTSTNTCASQTARATYNISIDHLPTASAGGNTAICQDASYTLTNGEASRNHGSIVWTENGQGSITAGGTTLNPTYTAAAGDAQSVVTLTMTVTSTNTCNPQNTFALYSIQVDPLPTVTVTGTTSICRGTSFIIPNGAAGNNFSTIQWTENGNGSLSSANSLTPTYNSAISDNGSVITLTLTVTSNNTCNSSVNRIQRDTYTIKVDSTPVAQAGGRRVICENSSLTISGTSYKDGTIVWTHNGDGNLNNINSLTPTYTAHSDDAGSVVTLTMTVTSNNSCNPQTALAFYTIPVDRLPQASVTGTTTICANDNYQLDNNAATAAYGSILWSKDAAAQGYISAGANTLRPTYTAGMNDGGNTVTLTMNVTSTNTCYPAIATRSFPITVLPVPTAQIAGSTTVCQAETTSPNITFTGNNGTPPYTFTYSLNNKGTQNISTSAASSNTLIAASTQTEGQYAYAITRVSDANNCAQAVSNTSARVTVNKLPTASISRSTTVCKNGPSPNITFTGNNGANPYMFRYTINGTDTTDIPSNGSNKALLPIATSQAGTSVYKLSRVSYNQGKVCYNPQSDSVIITINPLPIATLDGGDEVCKDSTHPVLVFKASNATAPYTFTFKVNTDNNASLTTQGNDSNYQFEVKTDKSGTFNYNVVKVTDAKGCVTEHNDVTETVVVHDNPTANFVASPTRTTILETTIELMESSISAETHYWTFGDGKFSAMSSPENHTYTDSGRYQIKLFTTTFKGKCKDSMIQEIIVEQPKLVYIPNTFTPNNDGMNDVFKFEGEGIKNLEMSIYDRWGNLVFYTNDKNKGWDGKRNGELVQIDTYVYLIIANDVKNHDHTYRGILNLIR